LAQPGEYERLNRPCATADGDTMLNYFDHLFKIVLVRVQAGLDRTIVKRSQVKDDDDHKPLNIARLKDCIMDINRRMSASRLKLNADKTELMIPAAGTKYAVNSASMHVSRLCGLMQMSTRSPAIAEGPRDAGVPVEIW